MDLKDIRGEIDRIDAELSALFRRRAAFSVQAALYKQEHSLPLGDESRERDILARAEDSAEEGMRAPVRRLFTEVLAECRQMQRYATSTPAQHAAFPGGRSVAFLGPEGSFSHEAFLLAFDKDAKPMPLASFEDIVQRVASGACSRGLLPVENSLTGGVFAAADLLTAGSVHIIGETVLAVRHCLLGIPGAVLKDVKTVLSHSQPLEQCRQFLLRRGYDTSTCASTAGAAREVVKRRDLSVAAIGSEAAARIYGLDILEHDIQDNPANYTRFAVISAAGEEIPGADKISAIFVVEHRPGTLYGTLRAFADRGVNILNLVSRPVPGSPWQYCFHMDFDGNLADARVKAALKEAGENCRGILLLGNYKKWESV